MGFRALRSFIQPLSKTLASPSSICSNSKRLITAATPPNTLYRFPFAGCSLHIPSPWTQSVSGFHSLTDTRFPKRRPVDKPRRKRASLKPPGPYAWVKYVPGEHRLPNQPNEGSVKRRNEKKRIRIRRAFIKSQQLGYDPSEELLGLEVDLPSRNAISGAPRPRSWFGPNGQYIRELPCPSCRGRGYTPCTECGIERSRMNCSQCSGKGIVTCHQCLGECVIWEESIDEQPWEKARSISPIKVKEDDEVDNLDIKLDVKKKSKRVYRSSPEVSLKISRALKSLNAKTGLFTNRMKIIHSNPTLHAQRVASIKKARGAPAARKHASEVQKAFFSNPENRHSRSISMKGIKFYCSHCGREGHRRHYCPELKDSLIDRRFRCRVCGEKGHNRRTCTKLVPRYHSSKGTVVARFHRCKMCGKHGHNRRTCPKKKGKEEKINNKKTSRKTYTCRLCQQKGHNTRSCPTKNEVLVGDTNPPS